MNKNIYRLFILFIFTGLGACQQIPNNVSIQNLPTEFIINSSTSVTIPNSGVKLFEYTPIAPTDNKFILFTPASLRTQIPTPTETEIPFNVCSPLAEETIATLFEIITNPFGNPPIGREDFHHGVDFAYYRRRDRMTIEGEIIQSILPGFVSASVNNRLPYGNMVIIETPRKLLSNLIIDIFDIAEGESLFTLYAHMGQSPQVKLGDYVTCGQGLGTVGKSGYDIVNPHLHLETRIGPAGTSFSGMAFYDTSALIEEMDNYKRWRTSGDFRNIDPMVIFQEILLMLNPTDSMATP